MRRSTCPQPNSAWCALLWKGRMPRRLQPKGAPARARSAARSNPFWERCMHAPSPKSFALHCHCAMCRKAPIRALNTQDRSRSLTQPTGRRLRTENRSNLSGSRMDGALTIITWSQSPAQHAPHLSKFTSKAAVTMGKRIGVIEMFRQMNQRSPADMALIGNDELGPALVANAELIAGKGRTWHRPTRWKFLRQRHSGHMCR